MELNKVYEKILDEVWTHFEPNDPPREGVVRRCIEAGCEAFLMRVAQGDDFDKALEVASKCIAIYAQGAPY